MEVYVDHAGVLPELLMSSNVLLGLDLIFNLLRDWLLQGVEYASFMVSVRAVHDCFVDVRLGLQMFLILQFYTADPETPSRSVWELSSVTMCA